MLYLVRAAKQLLLRHVFQSSCHSGFGYACLALLSLAWSPGNHRDNPCAVGKPWLNTSFLGWFLHLSRHWYCIGHWILANGWGCWLFYPPFLWASLKCGCPQEQATNFAIRDSLLLECAFSYFSSDWEAVSGTTTGSRARKRRWVGGSPSQHWVTSTRGQRCLPGICCPRQGFLLRLLPRKQYSSSSFTGPGQIGVVFIP